MSVVDDWYIRIVIRFRSALKLIASAGGECGMDALTSTVLQLGGLLSDPLGQLLAVIVVIGVVVLVGRIVLRVAWRLVTIAAVVVGLLLLATMFLPGLL
jgi:hypothetical protein